VLKKELKKEKLLKLKLNIVIRKKKLKNFLENIVKKYSAFLHSNLFKKNEEIMSENFYSKMQ